MCVYININFIDEVEERVIESCSEVSDDMSEEKEKPSQKKSGNQKRKRTAVIDGMYNVRKIYIYVHSYI